MAALPSSDSYFPQPGTTLGCWLLVERIGKGGHGVVFHAVNAGSPEAGSYALKLALEAGDARFEREAHLLSQVQHPSVPRLEGSGFWKSPGGETHPYLVMQRVEGLHLYAWAIEHEITVRQIIEQLAQVARALEATHLHGVHRDVKGANIRVSPKGHAVLLDFGCCWYPGASPLTGRALPPGTKGYRSPQLLTLEFALEMGSSDTYQFQPEDDVYALGITAYRLLAGVYPPLDSDGTTRPEAPSGLNDVCPELGELIVRMLAEDPKARGSAKRVAERLEQLLEFPNEVMDTPWVANASRLSTEKAKPLAPPNTASKAWVPISAVAGSSLVLALLGVLLTRDVDCGELASAESEPTTPVSEKPDAGTSLGEEALASVSPNETSSASQGRISRAMPKDPLPAQKRPPCMERGAVTINGGCWLPLGAEAGTAPCDPARYEYKERCYIPVLINGERIPTSDDLRRGE